MTSRRLLLALSIAAALALLTGCSSPVSPSSSPEPEATDDSVVVRTVAYPGGDGADLDADLCYPRDSSGPLPAVVLVHGGAFESGDRSSMAEVCRLVASWGYAGLAVDYRLVPTHTFPAQVDDVDAAVAWLRGGADPEGPAIDPDAIGLLGSSAGAIMALSSAERLDGVGSPVRFVVGLSAAGDLTADALSMGAPPEALQAAVLAYLGCADIEDCDVAADASPIYDAGALPRIFLVHSEDDVIPVAQAEALAHAVVAAGGSAELTVSPGDSHGLQLMTPDTRRSIESFIRDAI